MDEDKSPDITDNTSSDDEGRAQIIINLESMIKSHITAIEKLQEEAKKHKEMLDDIFKNDPTYTEHLEKAKEASKIKTATRAEILKRPQAAELHNKVKSLKSELAETQDALTDYLREFQRMSGLTEIEGEDGEVREIIFIPKLVKKSSQF